jgi:cell division protein ZapA (FtsZ GTPase activity inhibitor)
MKEVSRASGAVDSLRIAVLAALNIADERFRLKEEVGEAQSQARVAGESSEQRVARLARQLGVALGE